MQTDENRDIVRRFHDEVIVGQDFDVARRLLHPKLEHARGAIGETITAFDPEGVAHLRTLAGHERFVAGTKLLRALFPEWNSRLEEIIAEGDKVVTRCIVTGRDKGGFLGASNLGHDFSLHQIIIHTVSEGRIKRIFALADQLGFWRALGADLPAGGDGVSQD